MAKKIKINKDSIIQPHEEELFRIRAKLEVTDAEKRELNKTINYWKAVAQRRADELEVALAIKKRTRPLIIRAKQIKGKSETVAMPVAVDWHVSEQVDKEIMNELNEVNLGIDDKRIRAFFRNSLRVINLWRAGTTINKMLFAILGDIIHGYIHEEFIEDNFMSPTQGVLWVQERLIAGIEFWLDEGKFEKIDIVCCIGNHGRTTQKPRISTAYKNSFEWLMYNELANIFRHKNETRVEFFISKGYHYYAKVFGRDIRFHHGDNIRYGGGVGGISIPVNKAIDKWNKARTAYLDIFGHWHQYIDHGKWVSCPCLIGYNPYAISIKAEYEPPAQSVVFIEKELGKTGALPVFLK